MAQHTRGPLAPSTHTSTYLPHTTLVPAAARLLNLEGVEVDDAGVLLTDSEQVTCREVWKRVTLDRF